MTIGDHSSTYNYSSSGDLTSTQYASGLRRIWTYDEMNLLSGSALYNKENDLLSSIGLTLNWNGRVTMTMQPRNVTTELIYDTSERVISATILGSGGLKFLEVTSSVSDSTVKSYIFGDQVSIELSCTTCLA